MKILVATYVTGQTDLFRCREYMRPFYPESEIVIFEPSHYILKIDIASGKVDIGKSINFSVDVYIHSSTCIFYVIEFDEIVEPAIKDPFDIFNKSYQFTINNQDIKTSFYAITGEFYLRLRRLKTMQEAMTNWGTISDLKQEVLDNSGIDFLLFGKDRVLSDFGGILTPIIVEEIPSNTDKLEKIVLHGETLFIQNPNIFYTTSEPIQKKIMFYTLITNFYGWQTDLTIAYLREMRKDIAGLKQGLQIKGNVGWEWEIQEFDIKRLNFLEYLPYYHTFDNVYSNVYIPIELKSWFNINDLKATVNSNLNSIQFTMTEIDRMVEEKQAASATRRTRNLEYLLTILGGLGGVAAILAALFAGGLRLETRIIAILLLLFIPLIVVLFEYLVRKGIAKRSREVYRKTKINNLIKERQWNERSLRILQEQGKAFPEAQAEYCQVLTTQIKQIEKEIENLSKIK